MPEIKGLGNDEMKKLLERREIRYKTAQYWSNSAIWKLCFYGTEIILLSS